MGEKWESILETRCFKPYKGVSSNFFLMCFELSLYKVSNPIREYLQMYNANIRTISGKRFKPYKGVSSNLADAVLIGHYMLFQTL